MPILASHTDSDLMARVRDGELESLSILFERHHRALFNFFVRLTGSRGSGEDLVQEVFVRILKYRQTYLSGSTFTTWMYQIARNVHVDQLRKQHGETALEDESAARIPDTGGLPADQRASRNQEVDLLNLALRRLPPEKRELLLLSRFQELRHEQIAAILACEVNTVKVRVHRAMKDLAGLFQQVAAERRI
jgi:RNA polymerase sigma factor (sigma-70 family)